MSCEKPDSPVHGGDWSGSSFASFYCNRGYTLHGADMLTCVDGKWNGDIPRCIGMSYIGYDYSG